jgi:nicotinamidase-related amidase
VATLIPDISRAAVLSMDLQSAILSFYTKGQDQFLPRVASVLKEARARAMTVIHVRVGFRPGVPEISSRNMLFAAVKNSVQWQQAFEGEAGAIHPAVAPQGEDIVVTKHRVSAFSGTDLAMILRAREIETLVLFGIATSGVVLSTLLQAADDDFRLVVLNDCCADLDSAVHSCLIEKVFPRMATVLSATEFVDGLKSA